MLPFIRFPSEESLLSYACVYMSMCMSGPCLGMLTDMCYLNTFPFSVSKQLRSCVKC